MYTVDLFFVVVVETELDDGDVRMTGSMDGTPRVTRELSMVQEDAVIDNLQLFLFAIQDSILHLRKTQGRKKYIAR